MVPLISTSVQRVKFAAFILFTVLYIPVTFSQDTLWVDEVKISDLPQGISRIYYRNGGLAEIHLKKGEQIVKSRKWDETGHLIEKIKCRRFKANKSPVCKMWTFEYHESGVLSQKAFAKLLAADYAKRQWKKNYTTYGKRVREKKE